MNPDAALGSYIDAAAPPGSPDHFLLLFTDPAQRDAAGAALALGKVILNIAHQGGDADIRRLKLGWWLEELDATRRGAPRHPLTKALAGLAPEPRWLPHLQPLIGGAHAVVDTERFESMAQLLRYAHCMAQRQALIGAATAEVTDEALANAQAAGVGIGLTELLFAADRRLPSEPFADSAQSGDPATPGNAAQLAVIADSHFSAMQADSAQRRQQATIWLQARLHSDALESLRRSGFDPAGALPHPLRRLWRAWREARTLRR